MRYYSAVKKRIIYCIYCLIIFTILVLSLTLIPKFKSKEHADGKDITYASSITLTCPREILVEVGTKVELSTDFLIVKPGESKSNLQISISSRVNNEDGIEFENNIITAKELGFYYIKFSVPKSKGYNLNETLVVHVVEQNSKIIQNIFEVTEGDFVEISNAFQVNDDGYMAQIIASSNVELEDGKMYFLEPGNAEVIFILTSDKVSYYRTFNFNIKKEPQNIDYRIEIKLENTNLICEVGEVVVIPYEILADGVEDVPQAVNVNFTNSTIIKIISADECFIILQLTGKGTTEIKLTSKQINSCSASISIIVE